MDSLTAFLQEHWLIIAAVIVVILIIVKVVKSVVKWLVILAMAAAVLIYGFNYTPEEIKEVGSKLVDVVDLSKDKAVSMIMNDSADAKFEATEDGGFVVSTEKFKLEGKTGSNEATFTYLGQSITLQLDESLKAFIEKAKEANAGN